MPSNISPQSVDDAALQTIADFTAEYVKRGLSDAYDAVSDFPSFLADPVAPTAPFLPAKQITRQVCRVWARGNAPASSPALDGFYAGTCEPYLDSIGENPGDGEIAPPFDGGQCDGECYIVSVVNDAMDTATFQCRGPIGGVRGVTIPGGGRLEVFARSEVNTTVSSTCLTLQSPGWVFTGVGGTAWDETSNPQITSIVTKSGGPDTCGNPPVVYYPAPIPPGLPPLPPLTINVPGIGPIDTTIEFNPDGSIEVCFPELMVCLTIDNPVTSPRQGQGNTPPEGQPATPVDTGPSGAAEGEAPEGRELEGLKIEVLETTLGANTYQNVAATVFRGIGYVRLGYSGRKSAIISASVAQAEQFYLAEVRGLTHWDVTANIGFNLRITPYYRDKDQ